MSDDKVKLVEIPEGMRCFAVWPEETRNDGIQDYKGRAAVIFAATSKEALYAYRVATNTWGGAIMCTELLSLQDIEADGLVEEDN